MTTLRPLMTSRIDQLAARGRRNPRRRIVRHADLRPMRERGDERFLHRLFCTIERTAQPDQPGDDPAMITPERRFDGCSNFDCVRHLRWLEAGGWRPGVDARATARPF